MGILRAKKQEKMEYTEENIQLELDRFFTPSSVKYSLDGLYVFDWESDKLLKMRSGLVYEFEIKISKADFKNDFKHKVDKHIILEGKSDEKYLPKYYELVEEYKRGGYGSWTEHMIKNLSENPHYIIEGHKKPNFFYYVVPKDLISADEVPSYAGLIYIDNERTYDKFITVKKAPQLHKIKYTDDELNLSEKFYYNMDNWRNKYRNQAKSIKLYKEKIDELTNREGTNKKSYVQLEEENIKYSKENKALKNIWDQNQKTIDYLNREMADNSIYISRLERKIREFDKDFDFGTLLDDLYKRRK